MRVVMLSREARWPGFFIVIWFFKLFAFDRGMFQYHGQPRLGKWKSIALCTWAIAMLEQYLATADAAGENYDLKADALGHVYYLVHSYLEFDFSKYYVFYPEDELQQSQARLREEVSDLSLAQAEHVQNRKHIVVIVSVGHREGQRWSANVEQEWLDGRVRQVGFTGGTPPERFAQFQDVVRKIIVRTNGVCQTMSDCGRPQSTALLKNADKIRPPLSDCVLEVLGRARGYRVLRSSIQPTGR